MLANLVLSNSRLGWANTQVLAYLAPSDYRLGWAKGKVLSHLVASNRRHGLANSQVLANLVLSDRRLDGQIGKCFPIIENSVKSYALCNDWKVSTAYDKGER